VGLGVPNFEGSATYTHTVRPRATKFGMVLGRGMFLGVSHAHIPSGGAKHPQHSGDLHVWCAHSMRNSNQILHDGDQTTWGDNFSGLTMPPAMTKIFLSRMLTQSILGSVANLNLSTKHYHVCFNVCSHWHSATNSSPKPSSCCRIYPWKKVSVLGIGPN